MGKCNTFKKKRSKGREGKIKKRGRDLINTHTHQLSIPLSKIEAINLERALLKSLWASNGILLTNDAPGLLINQC